MPLRNIAAVAALLALAGCGGSTSTAPVSPTLVGGHLIGMYGAKDTYAVLQLTNTGGQLTLFCGWGGPLSQPITPDSHGHFDVPGILNTNVPDTAVHYVGTVTGNTLLLSVVEAGGTFQNYTLTAGQQPTVPSTSPYGCPG